MTRIPGDKRRGNHGRLLLKLAIAAAAAFVVLAPTPSRADCPDGYCPDGTELPMVQERRDRAARERNAERSRCSSACFRESCGNRRDNEVCLHEHWGDIRSCEANCR